MNSIPENSGSGAYQSPHGDSARMVTLIETKLKRIGDGKSEPVRIVTQYWTLDGRLICEVDPVSFPA
jgi:hypothetical protein